MLKKITEIFTEEEIVEAILGNGAKEKVQKLVADEEFIKKYIVLMLENEIAIDNICDVVESTTSPELLHTIAKAIVKVEDVDLDLLDAVLDNPYCSGETIVYIEDEYDCCYYWTSRAMDSSDEIHKKGYSKEKLWKIAEADKNGICTVGIIEFPNCDEELFYKIFENCKDNAMYYSNICGMALKQTYTLRQDILEEVLENFLEDWAEDIDDLVMKCNEVYLERVMAKIEETASEDVREKARAAYAEREKGGK